MNLLTLNGIQKSYGQNNVLNEINFSVEPGQIIVLLGPSGTGKSTLLSIIAGLTKPDSGQIELDGIQISNLAVHKRQITLLTQKANLFPFMSVADNVAFSPNMKLLSKSERDKKVNSILEEVSLSGYNNRNPETLSGGEQQRVSLARALCSEPKVLLLDEPFASLDHNIRIEHQKLLKKLVQDSALPVIFVTHQLDEAMSLADKVIVIDEGTQWSNQIPQELYDKPSNPTSAKTVGFNVIDGVGLKWLNKPNIDTNNLICVRPENIVMDEKDPQIIAKCIGYLFLGSGYKLNLELSDGQTLDVLTGSQLSELELERVMSTKEIGIRSDFWLNF